MSMDPLFSGVRPPLRQFQPSLPSEHRAAPGEAYRTSKHPPLGAGAMESSLPRKKPRLNSGGNTETENGDDPFDDFGDDLTAEDLEVIDMIATQALSQAPTSNTNGLRTEGTRPASTSQFQPKPSNNLSSTGAHGFRPNSQFPKALPYSSLPSGVSRRPPQADMSVPFHQLSSQHMRLPPSTSGNNFLKKRTAVSGGGDGNARSQLTPPKGSTVQDQPALPLGTQDGPSDLLKVQQQLERFKAETERLNQQVSFMKSEKCRKDGEIEVLRQNLNKSQADISRLQVEKIERDDQKQREQVAKERELGKQVETLRTQLEFKEREIVEAQTSFRNLQQRAGQGALAPQCSTAEPNHPSPRKSPRLVQVSSPSRPTFPSKLSFMGGGSKSPKAKSESPMKGKGSRVKAPAGTVSTCITSSPSTVGMRKSCSPQYRAAVHTRARYPKGCIAPSQLIGKLMNGDDTHTSGDQTSLLSVFSSYPTVLGDPADMEIAPDRTSRLGAATRSISHLLNPPSGVDEYQPRPISGYLASAAVSSAADSHLSDLLPVIQGQLDSYVQGLETLAAAVRPHPRTNPPCDPPQETEPDAQETLVRLRGQALEPSLKTLGRLCCYSDQVCQVIRTGCGRMEEGMTTSTGELDPSAPILSTQTTSRTGSSVLSSVSAYTREPCRIVQLLQSILAFQPVKGHPSASIIDGGWSVVSLLARNIPETQQQLNWCLPFLLQDSLSIALSSYSTMATKMSVVLTMSAVARLHPLCSQSDSCPILHICQLSTSGRGNSSEDDLVLLRIEILHLLLAVISCPSSGVTSLVETNCQCSFEVVSSIVSMMFSELKKAESKQTSQRFNLFKQGLLLLHTIQLQTRALHDQKTETEMELMLLTVRLHRLMKKSDVCDRSSVSVLQDLWECEAGDDDIWGDDSEEDEAMQE